MADNVAITAGSGTDIATDDVGGVHYQKIKPAYGAADSATLVSETAPLPVRMGTPATGLTTRSEQCALPADSGFPRTTAPTTTTTR